MDGYEDKRMGLVEITVKLPEELVEEAREFDLLTQQRLAEVLRSEVDRCVMAMVNAEIQAHRAEKAAKRSDDSRKTE
jgi:hypothetical protein